MLASPTIAISDNKRKVDFGVLDLTLFLAGSVFGDDWMNYFNKTSSLYPAVASPLSLCWPSCSS